RRPRHALRRGRLGVPDAGGVGPGLGGVDGRDGDHPVHLLPAGRRHRLPARARRAHLRPGAHRDVPAGGEARLRPEDVPRRHPRRPQARLRGPAQPLQLRAVRPRPAAHTLRPLRGRGRPAPRRGPPLPGLRVRDALLARLQPAGRPRRALARREAGLRAARAPHGRGHGEGVPRSPRRRRGPRVNRDLLFEIGTEELPAWYVTEGSRALGSLLAERLAAAGLAPADVTVYATPRRLAALATGVPDRSAERVEERRGPSVAVAFDAQGAPTRAAEAFARSSGVDVASLERRPTDKGDYVYARVRRGGEP